MNALSDERGQVTVFIALFMGLLMLGFLAFALDMGYLFHEKRMAQAAADAAVVAAAEELPNGASAEINAANVAAGMNGFDTTLATNPATVVLTPMASGNYSNANGATAPQQWVQAVVSQPIHTFFLGAFNHGMKTVVVSASAVAGGGVPTPTCICLTSASGDDLNMSNDAHLNGNACGITADSSSSNAITIVGSASVCGTSVGAVSTNWDNSGNINNAGTICPTAKAVQGATPCGSAIVAPIQPSGLTCTNNPIQGYDLYPGYNGNYTLPFNGAKKMVNGNPVAIPNDDVINSNVCYTSFNLSNAASVTFNPGVYYINGDFTTGGGETISGTGVTFVVTGNINIANGVTLNLTAPTAADGEPGVLFYVPNASSTVTLQGGSNTNFHGIFWAPNSVVTLNNGTGTSTEADFVANKLNMAGGATLNSYASVLLGGGAGGGSPALAQ